MKHKGRHYRTIWLDSSGQLKAIDQRLLPHEFKIADLTTLEDAYLAIKNMLVRGAPLIGVAAAYGMYLAALEQAAGTEGQLLRQALQQCADRLQTARPTAVNLACALNRQRHIVRSAQASRKVMAEALRLEAERIAEEEVSISENIGAFGLNLIRALSETKGGAPVNVLTHCNAGWLCTVDLGTATAPIYKAFDAGIPVHVWVDETRPRNQGASLTAWELGSHGVPYTLVTDNAGGHLMQNGMVDLVIVGTDRTTRGGDVANKIGTYLKALAAHANAIPFYVAAPSSSIDWLIESGKEIPIEERGAEEITHISGLSENGLIERVRLAPDGAAVANFGFDVTPRHLITGIITERGICCASEEGLFGLFPERRAVALS